MKLDKGLVHVYTGNGKGKTTASLGQAFRSSGSGLKVLIVQFFKPSFVKTGEWRWKNVRGMPRFCSMELSHPFFGGKASKKKMKESILKKLKWIQAQWCRGHWDMVVLDEINNAFSSGFIIWKDFVPFFRSRPKNVELICTGRGAPRQLLRAADYVTEMKKVKHPFDCGVRARKGIEY